MGYYTYLSMSERRQFYTFLEMGLTFSEISQRLGRNRSSLYRELERNQTQGEYLPDVAHEKSIQRRFQNRQGKLLKNRFLQDYVINHLKEGWSPEQISGRMKLENKPYAVCHETIYRFIYKKENINLYQYLHYKKLKRRKRFARKQQKCRYGDIRLITKRPVKIGLRTHYGHWEGDTIEFHGTKKTTITTLVERKSRLVHLIKNENKFSENLMRAIKENFKMKIKNFLKQLLLTKDVNLPISHKLKNIFLVKPIIAKLTRLGRREPTKI